MNCKKNRYLWPFIASVLCACALSVAPGSLAPKEGRDGQKAIVAQEKEDMITLAKENDGGEYRFHQGQMFQVILPENPTSGYLWAIAEPAPSYITLIRQEYTANPHDSHFVGAGGVRTLTFQTVNEGSVSLVLLLRRPWEAEGEHKGEYVDSFHVNLHIK